MGALVTAGFGEEHPHSVFGRWNEPTTRRRRSHCVMNGQSHRDKSTFEMRPSPQPIRPSRGLHPAHDQRSVDAAETEAIGQGMPNVARPRPSRNQIEIRHGFVRIFQIQCWRQPPPLHR